MTIGSIIQVLGPKQAPEKEVKAPSKSSFEAILQREMGRSGNSHSMEFSKQAEFSQKLEYLLDLLDNYQNSLASPQKESSELRSYFYQMGEISNQLEEIISSQNLPEALKEIAQESIFLFRKEQAKFLTGLYA